ncbi:MAG: hypothetical protein L7F78_14135, partial [Syntrophales bacterium LBB04]|nr:hypothetical protein [Syntrophales bacterium LBB04]
PNLKSMAAACESIMNKIVDAMNAKLGKQQPSSAETKLTERKVPADETKHVGKPKDAKADGQGVRTSPEGTKDVGKSKDAK